MATVVLDGLDRTEGDRGRLAAALDAAIVAHGPAPFERLLTLDGDLYDVAVALGLE